MKINNTETRRNWGKIVLSVSAVWCFIGMLICCLFVSKEIAFIFILKSFLTLWVLSLLDLFVLAKMVKSALFLAVGTEQKKRGQTVGKLFFWGLIKVFIFILFVLFFMKASVIPGLVLVIGLSTLVIIPIVSGWIWARESMRYA
ncbi:MAG: hypothetical protein AAB116_09080 [Candidatus Poribacteria bacterium]